MESAVTDTKPAEPEVEHSYEQCVNDVRPVAEVLTQIASKWTIFVITDLSHGPSRFSELKRRIGGISQKMLTATLRDLERDGFVKRTVTPSIPPRVDYELTAMGRELREPLKVLSQWAVANQGRVAKARERFETRQREQAALRW